MSSFNQIRSANLNETANNETAIKDKTVNRANLLYCER